MVDEQKKNEDENLPEEGEESQPVAGKSGLIKKIIFGVAGLVAVVAIAFATLLFVGGDSHPDEAAADNTTATEADSLGDEFTAEEDSILAWLENAQGDESVLDNIMRNLEILDYQPTDADIGGAEVGMSPEDSIEMVNWLDKEKSDLAKRESDLSAREKQLNVLDAKVTQKLLSLEQAESSRIALLARLYDGMDVKAVARLAANLDDATVVLILPRMKLKNASSVLALLPPKRGARLSKQMITIADK